MIILKANKVNLFVSPVLFVFWYHSLNFLDTPRIYSLIQHSSKQQCLILTVTVICDQRSDENGSRLHYQCSCLQLMESTMAKLLSIFTLRYGLKPQF
jgi:hypothetical protein